jgi:hypothetical protein
VIGDPADEKTRPVVTSRQPMDYVGLITLIIGVGALQIVLDKGNDLTGSNRASSLSAQRFRWSPWRSS